MPFFAYLQWLQDNPEQFTRERDQRYSESPPPYPSSGETMQPDSPRELHVIDESHQRYLRTLALLQSTPSKQFDRQEKRERKRMEYQIGEERFGRRQTLPFDETQDLRANAENNVRARWVAQGIWKEEWGPAWRKGAKPMDNKWSYSGKILRGPHIECVARWAHEKEFKRRLPPGYEQEPEPESHPNPGPPVSIFSGFKFRTTGLERGEQRTTAEKSAAVSVPATQREPEPEPDSESESEPDDAPISEPDELTKAIFPAWKQWLLQGRAEKRNRRAEKRRLRAEQRENRRKESAPASTVYQLNTEASRPYHQFLYQASKEREWIRDELLYKRSIGFVDIDAMAYEAVKKHWMEDDIWNPQWGELPGMTWMHVDLHDKQLEIS
jgi:hypothetical protein